MKKATNEDVKKLLAMCVEEINDQYDDVIWSAQTRAENARKKFENSLTEEQRKLYNDFIYEQQRYVNAIVQKNHDIKQ